MKFEKLSENKLRITLNIRDLTDNDIDYQSFMANSGNTQKLFLDMLDKAEREVGFVTKNYKIMIEALVTSTGGFVVTVTRSLPDELHTSQKKRTFKTKRKSVNSLNNKIIYSFNSFDDFCLFCNSLDKNIVKNLNKISKEITLHFFKNTYYLLIENSNTNYVYTKSLINYLAEFGTYSYNSHILSYELSEYGKLIFKNNAIKLCLKYFS